MNEISKENYIMQGSLVITNVEGTNIYHQLMVKVTSERTLNQD